MLHTVCPSYYNTPTRDYAVVYHIGIYILMNEYITGWTIMIKGLADHSSDFLAENVLTLVWLIT